MSRLDDELATLSDKSPAELRERWLEISDQPPPSLPAWLLRSLLTSRLQERRYGSLPASVRRELERVTAEEDDAQGAPSRRKLSPGARLVREWNGRTIAVEVIEGGYRHNDRSWRSLSEIARHVTGAHWSGPRFFGLNSRG